MQLKKATRKQVKMRLQVSGPAGSGKTYSSLLMAYGITQDWSKVAVIDTENGSASLYSHLGEFLTIGLEAPYSPERFITAIEMCEKAGVEVCIIDSASHEWNGSGGCLEINDTLANAKYKGNTWAAWNETTPRHDKFVNKWLNSSMHMILCTRSKTETIMGDDKKVKKVGMKDIQRDGLEYEFTVSFNIDRDTHMAIAGKDRTMMFIDSDLFRISEDTGKKILKWCNEGIVVEKEIILTEEEQLNNALLEMASCGDLECLKTIWTRYKPLQKNPLFSEAKEAKKKEIETKAQ